MKGYSRDRSTRDVLTQLDAIEAGGGKGTLALPTGKLDVTNMKKVFFPKSGHTKGDLLRYYTMISRYLLPAIADRPLVLKRYPNGIDGKAFYQHKAPDEAPRSVRVDVIPSPSVVIPSEARDLHVGINSARDLHVQVPRIARDDIRLIGGDLATLLYIAQLGAVSVDPWHSRVQTVEHADYSIVDLDPGPKSTFEQVIQVACWVKEALDDLGLHGVPKTSGASGIHVVLPLGRNVPNDSARMVAQIVATTVADRHPKEATVTRAVKARSESSVYVDYLQNIRGKTVAGVYSVRANEGATVSMPLSWDEVAAGLEIMDFTVDNAEARLAKVGDLWAKGMKKPNRLDRLGN